MAIYVAKDLQVSVVADYQRLPDDLWVRFAIPDFDRPAPENDPAFTGASRMEWDGRRWTRIGPPRPHPPTAGPSPGCTRMWRLTVARLDMIKRQCLEMEDRWFAWKGGGVGAAATAAPVSDDPTQPDPVATVAISDEAFSVVAARFRRILELVGEYRT